MERIYVHCKTKELWRKVERHAVEGGVLWCNHKKTNDEWYTYGNNSVIVIGCSMAYCDVDYYTEKKIITAEEYLKEGGENVSEFKVGDRVEVIEDYTSACIGMKGVLIKPTGREWVIEFDDWFLGEHNCGGQVKNRHGYYVGRNYIKLINKGGKTMSLNINSTIRKVFAGAEFEQVEKMQHHFGNEIQENFSGEIFLKANKKKFEDEIVRLEKEAEDKQKSEEVKRLEAELETKKCK